MVAGRRSTTQAMNDKPLRSHFSQPGIRPAYTASTSMAGWPPRKTMCPLGGTTSWRFAIPSGNPELSSGAYYNYLLTGTDPTEWHAKTAKDYSTDVVAAHAEQFVRNSVDGAPFFLMFTPFAPHPPFTPADRDLRYLGSTAVRQPSSQRNGHVRQADLSDKIYPTSLEIGFAKRR